jgi:hypothetical protein
MIVGGDRDIHGCIGSAGYTWSAPMKQCIRTWEYYTIDADSPDTGNTILDAHLQKIADRIIRQFRLDAEMNIAENSLSEKPHYELDIQYSVVNSGSLITVKMDTYTDLGGAHGNAAIYIWNYNTKTKKNIPLFKIISRKNLVTLSKNIETYLIEQLGTDTTKAWLQDGLSAKKPSNYSKFTLHTNSAGDIDTATFYFSPYQVGPHSIGTPTVTVNLKDLSVI